MSMRKKHAIFLLHGLFGSSENLSVIKKGFLDEALILPIAARNHANGLISQSMSYPEMANDIIQLFNDNKLNSCDIIGHSMGGKTAMCVALDQKIKVNHLIVMDIAPKPYPLFHSHIIDSLKKLDLNKFKSKTDVSKSLIKDIPNTPLRQFLIKNISSKQDNLSWKINLSNIASNYSIISSFPENYLTKKCLVKTLFLYGNQSNYVQQSDFTQINNLFQNVQFQSVNASHWIHAEQPNECNAIIQKFLKIK